MPIITFNRRGLGRLLALASGRHQGFFWNLVIRQRFGSSIILIIESLLHSFGIFVQSQMWLLDVIKAHIMLGTVGNTLPALARPGQKNMDKKLITEFLLNAMTYVPKPPKTVPVRLVAYRRHVNALRDMLATHVTAPQAVSLSMCLLEQLLREAIKEKEDQACAAHDSDSDDVYDD